MNRGSAGPSLDRAVVDVRGDRVVAVLADGAGGAAGGAQAADGLIAARTSLDARAALASSGRTAARWIEAADRTIAARGHGGHCTAVAIVGDGERIVGASVGDSGAWICLPSDILDLTASQQRRPFVGSGDAVATPFACAMPPGRWLVASDGLLKYATRERVAAAARHGELGVAADRLVDLVRLRSGALQDDISVVLVERVGVAAEATPRGRPR